MDETRCARIVWSITKDFSAETGSSQELVLLRNALAEAIIATDGDGFSEPAEVDRSHLETPAWKGCVAGAIKTKSPPPTALKYLLLWPQGDTGRPAELVPLKWARKGMSTPEPKSVIGQVAPPPFLALGRWAAKSRPKAPQCSLLNSREVPKRPRLNLDLPSGLR